MGRYYDQNGHPTGALQIFEQKVINANQQETDENERKQIYPPCNIQWKPEEGTKVWCTDQRYNIIMGNTLRSLGKLINILICFSGGISRNWIGVPRQYFEMATGKERCVCVRLDSPEYVENKASFSDYKNCAVDATSCFIET